MKRSEIERHVGICESEVTQKEKEAVERIRDSVLYLSDRQKSGSITDVITDLSVAIASELRRAKKAP